MEEGLPGALLLAVPPGPAHQGVEVVLGEVAGEEHAQVVQPIEQKFFGDRNAPKHLIKLAGAQTEKPLDGDKLNGCRAQIRRWLLVEQVGEQWAVAVSSRNNTYGL